MLVLAMEFSRSECRRRGLIDPRGDSGGQPAIPLKGSSALTRHAAAGIGRSATCKGWLPLQNGTEGSGPVATTVGGNPATAVSARGSSSQWSTGCSLEEATHGTKPLVVQDELLRKEVIQPHLPVRLPCYDFTPIADPTFDGSLLAVGPPASGVTNFRGVTGGVYKARERIHPGVADPGLLATPTSWSRVADSNPN
jgi:hypothetical protein